MATKGKKSSKKAPPASAPSKSKSAKATPPAEMPTLPMMMHSLPRPGAPRQQRTPIQGSMAAPMAQPGPQVVSDPGPLLPGFRQAHVDAARTGVPLQGPPPPGMGIFGPR